MMAPTLEQQSLRLSPQFRQRIRGYLLFTVGVVIGTSGWQYADWRGRLYPRGLAQKGWLTDYSDRFQSVEVNNVFYRLPEKATFERWAAANARRF